MKEHLEPSFCKNTQLHFEEWIPFLHLMSSIGRDFQTRNPLETREMFHSKTCINLRFECIFPLKSPKVALNRWPHYLFAWLINFDGKDVGHFTLMKYLYPKYIFSVVRKIYDTDKSLRMVMVSCMNSHTDGCALSPCFAKLRGQ